MGLVDGLYKRKVVQETGWGCFDTIVYMQALLVRPVLRLEFTAVLAEL